MSEISENTSNNRRIAKNTLLLYIRMFLIMGVTLYTSRIVLEQLGVEDYGIYSLVGGVVSMLSVLTHSLSGACSRFINFEQGTGNKDKLKAIVSTSFNIQILLSIVIVIILESLGVWFLNTHLTIPLNRLSAANVVLQFSIATFVVRLLLVPLNALIISHERMGVYAYFSIVDVVMQLLVVYMLKISPYDKLEMYSFLMFIVPIIVFFMYLAYCKKSFEECVYKVKLRKDIFKEMLGFAGWNFIGVTAGVLRHQGIDLIINMFFGVVLNAARGIASQVSTAITRFSSSFMTAINPQITKAYAAGNIERLEFLVHQGSRFSFYLLMCVSIPLIVEMDMVLKIWLKNVPEYATVFSRFMIVEALCACLSSTMITALLATGKIKKYQLMVGLFNILNFPISYLFLVIGYPPYITYIVMIIIEIGCLYFRLYMIREMIGIKIAPYIKAVIFNILIVSFLAIIPPLFCVYMMPESMLRFMISVFVSLLSCFAAIYFIGLSRNEKILIKKKILKR